MSLLQDAVKGDAGHVEVEKYISTTFDNWVSFRPQYMIGSGNNKDCEEWFFDRTFIDSPHWSSDKMLHEDLPTYGMNFSNRDCEREASPDSRVRYAVDQHRARKGSVIDAYTWSGKAGCSERANFQLC